MISFLDGILEDVDPESATLNVGGIGFTVYMGGSALSALPQIGERVRIYTYFQVREDGMALYGFMSRDALNLFKKVISVSGIGPKGGLSLLSALTPEDLMFSIASGDAKTIAKAPGIGKRTAERLILELKDKVDPEAALADYQSAAHAAPIKETGPIPEALQALISLGYSQSEARNALKDIEATDTTDVQDILQQAFKRLL